MTVFYYRVILVLQKHVQKSVPILLDTHTALDAAAAELQVCYRSLSLCHAGAVACTPAHVYSRGAVDAKHAHKPTVPAQQQRRALEAYLGPCACCHSVMLCSHPDVKAQIARGLSQH
jgi:hypothetical protein